MISYTIYKVIHLTCLVAFYSFYGVQILGEKEEKKYKILGGVASVLILVSGMGLLARIGISHGNGWPVWAIVKMVAWFILAGGIPLVAKRLPAFSKQYYWFSMILFIFLSWMINEKPF